VGKDNTVAVRDQWWQLDKSRWRHSLAGQTVTIHQHLDGTVSIRYGPHVVGRGKDGPGKPKPGFPPLLGNRLRRFPLSHRPDHESSLSQTEGEEGSMKPNRTTNVLIKPDNYKS
jgi:hypothetical protein